MSLMNQYNHEEFITGISLCDNCLQAGECSIKKTIETVNTDVLVGGYDRKINLKLGIIICDIFTYSTAK